MVIFFSNSSGWEINESCLSSNMKPTFSGTNKLQLNLQMELPCRYGALRNWAMILLSVTSGTGFHLMALFLSSRLTFISCTFSEVLVLKVSLYHYKLFIRVSGLVCLASQWGSSVLTDWNKAPSIPLVWPRFLLVSPEILTVITGNHLLRPNLHKNAKIWVLLIYIKRYLNAEEIGFSSKCYYIHRKNSWIN